MIICTLFLSAAFSQSGITLGIIADCQFEAGVTSAERNYDASLRKLDSCLDYFNRQKVQGVFHLGDVINRGFRNFDLVLAHFGKSRSSVHFVLGNHEYEVADSLKSKVPAKLGLSSPYYTVDLGDWLCIILNGDDLGFKALQDESQTRERDSLVAHLKRQHRSNVSEWNGGLSRKQMQWLQSSLEQAQKDGRKVLVMSHFPVYPASRENLLNDIEVVELLADYPCVKAWCCGHRHEGDYAQYKGIHFLNFRGMVEGTGNAYALLTLTSDSIIIDGKGREPSKRLAIRSDQPLKEDYKGNPQVDLPPGITLEEAIGASARVSPSPRQWRWQQQEMAAFLHFGLNTFTNKEWSEGKDDPGLFNPRNLDTDEWIKVLKEAGFRLVVITAKHHDGFCLWPSAHTSYSVKSSPWKGGKGDVVGEVALSCRKSGLDLGIYLSPWDRHEPSYGDQEAYNLFFRDQLTELLTQYGDIAEVWFDGACGEGPNGRKQVYDWSSCYQLIRKLQPGAVIAVMGPDVRWVGTESGYGRETEWSVLPIDMNNTASIAQASQQNELVSGFIPRDLTGEDLGSRDKLRGCRSLIWYPSEADVSIRPGWFYHPEEDNKVKTPEHLFDIYFNSVGKNSQLLLNIPPDRDGRIHEQDRKSLQGFKDILDETFFANLAQNARCESSVSEDGKQLFYDITLEGPKTFDVVMLQEDIRHGQRVEKFSVAFKEGDSWTAITGGTTIGYKRLLRFPEITAREVRISIEGSRGEPWLLPPGLFLTPASLKPSAKPRFPVVLETRYSEKYPAGGPNATVDGMKGSWYFQDGRWQGYEGTDFTAIITLGDSMVLTSVSTRFLQDTRSWIFLPGKVEYFISEDGRRFQPAGSVTNPVSDTLAEALQPFRLELPRIKAKYLKVKATNRKVCPPWHPGSGGKAWIFVDEILVNEP